MPEEDLVELKFRLYDGSDVGPFQYSPTATVAMLKERLVSEWPKDKKIVPKAASDIKLINAGKILENGKTVAQCKAPFDDLPKSVITMHVVVQLSPTKARPDKQCKTPNIIGFLWSIAEKKIEEEEAPQRSLCSYPKNISYHSHASCFVFIKSLKKASSMAFLEVVISCIVMKTLLLLVNSLSPKHSSAKPNAEVTVMGFVYCDVCSNNTFSRHSYFMSGVEVRIVCRFKSASSTTNEMVTFSANRTTNEFGLYKVATTSLDCADVDSLASSCQASLVGRRSSSDISCNVPGYRTTTDQVVFKSKRSNLCIYGFNALNFRPFKSDLALCGKK
ncbi:hypothetical protein IGI04_024824 [Brassica rapa subsp. trilocularis]|uniref:Ubiquitin-like domain-containing protein n=1 Tax=Brassica rapa subsp. trilocularis TaxID=1813537 RepID=A0ABQ7M7T5_BRACM|nr:hypothetical protein IGI04_024824 [Brassica rapa subsp. trilocularis]